MTNQAYSNLENSKRSHAANKLKNFKSGLYVSNIDFFHPSR